MREHDKMLAVGIGLIADTVYNKMINVCMKDNVLSAEAIKDDVLITVGENDEVLAGGRTMRCSQRG